MNLNRYTERAQESILSAQQLAERGGSAEVLPEHLLLALLYQRDGVVPAVLCEMTIDAARLAAQPRAPRDKLPKGPGAAQARTSAPLTGVPRPAAPQAEA